MRFSLWIIVSLLELCTRLNAAELDGPQTINDLIAMAFPEGAAPKFQPLPSTPQVAIASNDSAILKIMDLKISDLPMKPGYITFQLHHFLSKDFPARSQMQIVSFTGNEKHSNTTLDICPYLGFANLHCPLKAYKRDEVMKQVLQVPDLIESGRFSFVAKVTTREGALIAHIAAIIDFVQDGTRVGEDHVAVHDEL